MALAVARTNDTHFCEAHGAGTLPDGLVSVRVNGQPAVRAGDRFVCGGCRNRMQTGASTVTIGGELAARLNDKSEHGGFVTRGSGTVFIGGPMGMGCLGAGTSMCQAMAAGRRSGETRQSYGNCVLESVRQIIRRAKGSKLTEDEMIAHALARGLADNKPGTDEHGGSSGTRGQRILEEFGIPAERMPSQGPATLGTIKQAIAERRGVVAFVDPKDIWPGMIKSGCHAVVVTGVELDEDGNVTAVFINDTGRGDCARRVSASEFGAAMRNLPTDKDVGGASLLVTKGAIW